MSVNLKLSAKTIKDVSLRMLQPYKMRANSPYLSEDQQRLCQLSLQQRSEWMAEWLQWANNSLIHAGNASTKMREECITTPFSFRKLKDGFSQSHKDH